MKNKFLFVTMITFSLSFLNVNKNIYKANASNVTARNITETQLSYYLNNYNYNLVYEKRNSNGHYVRYDLIDTRTFGERYYLNISVDHNADLASTIIEFESISFIGLSYTEGFGLSVEGSAPGYYCSFVSEMSVTTSTNYVITESMSNILKGVKDSSSNYAPSGTYYLYYRECFIDSIIVKRDSNNSFVSAEYYSSCPEDSFFLEIIQTRPTTDSSVLLIC